MLLTTNDDNELLDLAPKLVANFLLNSHPVIEKSVHYSLDIEKELQKDPIFCVIYLLATIDPISRGYISYQYGIYG